MKRLIIIDGNAIVHRSYHALPPLKTKKGELVNAIYGFLLAFFKAVKDFNPDYIVATFDLPAPTFRHKKYKLYKANREKAPDDLYTQIPKIKDILKEFGVEIFEKKGFEADDLIGTISKLAPRKQIHPRIESIILTGDLDALQLVNKNTKVNALRKGVKDTVLYDEEGVKERYDGLIPNQLVDYKALRGDPSDNIPGVNGIGEKTAISLIKEYHSLDGVYKNINKIKGSTRDKLIGCEGQAYVSQMLARINQDVSIDFDLEKCAWKGYNKDKVTKVLERYEFRTLIDRVFKEPDKKNLTLL